MLFQGNSRAALHKTQNAETAEEIISVLTAISVISKRMAKKLTLLTQRAAGKEGSKPDGEAAAPTDAC